MTATCCFGNLMLAKVGVSVLCVVLAAAIASFLTSLRYLMTQRTAGGLEQLWSLYGSIREERMILRAG